MLVMLAIRNGGTCSPFLSAVSRRLEAARLAAWGWVPAAVNAALLSFSVYCFGRFFVPWVNRAKWLNWSVKYTREAYGWIGDWMMFTANHSMLFIWAVALLAAVALVIAFAQSIRVT